MLRRFERATSMFAVVGLLVMLVSLLLAILFDLPLPTVGMVVGLAMSLVGLAGMLVTVLIDLWEN